MSELATTLPSMLLPWVDRELRDLPWRRTRDPWAVLVAETMLQQTQVSRVEGRWVRFLERFPDPASCAAAPAADLLREWAGLGYNRRALMLHRAATAIRDDHGGRVPSNLESLMALPGVGAYTARAVLAFAFEDRAAPVDTNIGRVLARLGGTALSVRAAQQLADSLVPPDAVWPWNQGVMELGAVVCTKRKPRCDDCPVFDACRWQGQGPDPAEGSAAVGRPQARFEGSDRQLRGRLIDLLRRGPATQAAVAESLVDAGRRERIVSGLLADGLIEEVEGRLQLTGETQPGPVSEPRSASIA